MTRVWKWNRPVTVREVLEDLQQERSIAYTTVMTVLDNLHQKGWVRREAEGRAYRYEAVSTRAAYAAALMNDAWSQSDNPAAVLVAFFGMMSEEQRAALRDAVRMVQGPENTPENTPEDALSVATFHSVFPQTLGMDIEAELIRPAIERLDGRICVSEACIGSLTPYFPYAYDVIPNGIDADHFSPDAEPVEELLGDHRNIVFIGRFDPRNGVDTMIRAHQLLFEERGAEVRLIIVGDGPLRPMYERLITDEARPYVHFAGRLNRSRPNYLVTGDVFCTPCDRASFGMVLLEAMSCGRAVAASRISGFQLLMEDGRQGFLVNPARSPERFADALRTLLDDDELRNTMAAEGRRTAVDHYSWPRVAAKLETYYRDLIAGRRPSWASAKSSLAS